ncbi:MAG: hypothetical protein QOJ12_2421 [Thermoleophilales bacterium]|nr:hypothetical protein [Thermoleophilales bacterium]
MPRTPARPTDPPPPAARRRGSAAASILIVDDEAAVCEGLRDHLVRAGYATEVATSADAAAELLANAAFDLLLCDVQMPGRSGLELVRQALGEYTSMAAIMMSGLDDPDVAESAVALGAYGYVVKPFTPNELVMQVRNALKHLELDRETAKRQRGVDELLAERTEALGSLQERQTLLERLSKIQRSLAQRGELEDVVKAIVDGAQELLGAEIAALRLIDEDEPGSMVLRAATGIADDDLAAAAALVSIDADRPPGEAQPAIAGLDVASAIAAPLYQDGELIGSVVVATRAPDRTFTGAEGEMLVAFADHASVALADVRLLDQTDPAHDPLTGLPNRNRFFEYAEQAIATAGADEPDPAVLLIVLDRFGVVNEKLRHEVGDALLVAVAERLADCMDPTDTVARFGGNDFAVLLQSLAGRTDPEGVAEGILRAFARPIELDGREIAVSASIGIASGRGDAHELVRHADIAMYRAHRGGKGRFERFSPGMKVGLLQQLALEADLQGALERDEFEVHYQPIVALHERQLSGFEALVRWRHPKRGLIPPLAFIPLAEEMGLMNSIGRWVLRESCREAARWQAIRPTNPPLSVNVNLSALELEAPDLVAHVKAALREFDIEPRRLVLEITETILMQDVGVAAGALVELKKLGVRLAIDDFGTGYSSLHYIRRFPLDILKIAKPFVDELSRAREETALVQTIIDLAANFNLQVVAEGVESLRQSIELGSLGCEFAQGYLFSRPMDRDTAMRMLERAGRGYGRLGETAGQDFSLPPLAEPAYAAPAR